MVGNGIGHYYLGARGVPAARLAYGQLGRSVGLWEKGRALLAPAGEEERGLIEEAGAPSPQPLSSSSLEPGELEPPADSPCSATTGAYVSHACEAGLPPTGNAAMRWGTILTTS